MGAVTAEFINITDGDVPPVDYCEASGNDYSYEWIAGVQFGSFRKTSGAAGYSDFSAEKVEVGTGNTDFVLTPGFASSKYNEVWKIWIDLNNDGQFGEGEEMFSSSATSSNVTGSFSIPASYAGTTTRMRVAMSYNQGTEACGSFNYGEVEDYTVVIGGDTGGSDSVFENTETQAIPDQGSISSNITVTNAIDASTVTIEATVDHSYLGDLQITAVKDGQSFTIKDSDRNDRASGEKTYNTIINAADLSSLDGEWTLNISDQYRQDDGQLKQWAIRLKK